MKRQEVVTDRCAVTAELWDVHIKKKSIRREIRSFWPEQLRQLPLTEKGKEQVSEGNSAGLGLDT